MWTPYAWESNRCGSAGQQQDTRLVLLIGLVLITISAPDEFGYLLVFLAANMVVVLLERPREESPERIAPRDRRRAAEIQRSRRLVVALRQTPNTEP